MYVDMKLEHQLQTHTNLMENMYAVHVTEIGQYQIIEVKKEDKDEDL